MLRAPALGRAGSAPAHTAFERRLLPALSSWFVERVRATQPDFLIPVETKGARLLEAILEYARDHSGKPVEVPVVYATALPYLASGALENARVLIVDDALRTGNNLQRHREKVERYGVSEVDTIVCVGYPESEPQDACVSEDPSVWCFMRVADDAHYRELLWQIAELVIAHQLPPEVDHHVFSLSLPERLPQALASLWRTLDGYGQLTVDAPSTATEDQPGLTLHFPTLPGVRDLPRDGDARGEGVNKLRFFPDPRSDEIYVVPMSFPALDLPGHAQGPIDRDRAVALVDAWTSGDDAIGRLLVNAADVLHPEVVFRVLSACTEVDLVRGFARVLAGAYPNGGVTLTAQRKLFYHLYGEDVGEQVATLIDREVALELAASPFTVLAGATRPAGRSTCLTLDEEVATTTDRIAQGLMDLYRDRSQAPGYEPGDRVGRSLSEIKASLPGASDLLVSRCIDQGLALTTFVPYVHIETTVDVVRVRRQYRVSELHRDRERPHDNIEVVRQEVSEESVALIARFLRTQTRLFADRPVPVRILTWLVAILRVLVLEDQGIELTIETGYPDPIVRLRDGTRPVTLGEPTSDMFKLEGDGILPTDNFERLYRVNSTLHLDLRESSVEFESRLGLLAGLIDALSEEKLEAALAGWSMSTDERLGLTFVLADLDAALDRMRRPLKLILRDEEHVHSPAECALSREHSEDARGKLRLLRADWQRLVHKGWPEPTKLERSLLRSIAAPKDAVGIFDFADALCELAIVLTGVVERLDAASASLWESAQGAEVTPEAAEAQAFEVARSAMRCSAEFRAALPGHREAANSGNLGSGARSALHAAANELLELTKIVETFAAAAAGIYQGTKGSRAPSRLPKERPAMVLFADISKAVEHALHHGFDVNADWKNSGLNMVAQWGKAFGGREVQDRPGDALWLDFGPHADGAVLCAAAVQQHMRALRSTGLDSLYWALHMAVDDGQLKDGDGGGVAGDCIDRSARCAKAEYPGKPVDAVLVTQEAAARCSSDLHNDSLMCKTPVEIPLTDAELPGSRIAPLVIDGKKIFRVLRDRVHGVAREIAASTAAPSPATSPDDEQGQIAASTAAPSPATSPDDEQGQQLRGRGGP